MDVLVDILGADATILFKEPSNRLDIGGKLFNVDFPFHKKVYGSCWPVFAHRLIVVGRRRTTTVSSETHKQLLHNLTVGQNNNADLFPLLDNSESSNILYYILLLPLGNLGLRQVFSEYSQPLQ